MKHKHNIPGFFICVFGVQAGAFLTSFPVETFPNKAVYLLCLFILGFSMIGTCVTLYHIAWQTLHDAKMDAELSGLKQQQHLQEEQSLALNTRRKQTLVLQQNMNHNLLNFLNLLENENVEEADAYLHEFTSAFRQERFRPICQNNLINAILESKQRTAEKHHIKTSYEILLPEDLNIDTTDLSSVFFNLLDNGIESCIRSGCSEPFLRLSVNASAGFLTIHMYNSKNPQEKFRHTTSKADVYDHGFGLSIIEDVCKKNDGTYEWKDEGEIFHSVILLRCGDEPNTEK
ncbi:ATP-binding protein [Ruminococcus sp. 5_1_39BFAA]|uniref:ATP-binding protein n=1 Tax=Ruminococcus sp. 5_1_39BFAA TaxID=457412 RepID=UPI00356387FF